MEGPLRRKTLLKEGRKPRVTAPLPQREPSRKPRKRSQQQLLLLRVHVSARSNSSHICFWGSRTRGLLTPLVLLPVLVEVLLVVLEVDVELEGELIT